MMKQMIATMSALLAGMQLVQAGVSRTPEEKMRFAVERTEPRTWPFWQFSQPYRFHAPAKVEDGKRYPLVVLMHGAGSRGTNNVNQIRVGGSDLFDWARRKGEDFFFLAPQCPEGRQWVDTPWGNRAHRMKPHPGRELEMAMDLVEDALWRYPVDPARVYVMGISMGGYATWELVQRRPHWFAAAIPCCGGGDVTLADRIKDIPIWAFHGDADSVVPTSRSRDMVRAIWALDGNVRYREYPGVGHNAWTPTFSDDTVFDWLFAQRKVDYPEAVNVPELMRTFDGRPVTTLADWEKTRRPEILELYTREVFGRRPAVAEKPARLSFACESSESAFDGKATKKTVRISFAGPYGEDSFVVTAFIPTAAKRTPAFLLINNRGYDAGHPNRGEDSRYWPVRDILARGYATASFNATDLAADVSGGSGFNQGVFPLFEKEADRTDESWGTISAWAWGASRVMDWIETEPSLDAKRVAVIGQSRGGKTALWAGATDTRFALICSNDSGCTGAKLNHVDLPKSEHIAQILATRQYWFCGNYAKYIGKEMSMDFDQHFLVALIAPRVVSIASAEEDSWAGPVGEWWTAVHASSAWTLYGLPGLVGETFPKPGHSQAAGCVAYHLRPQTHDLLPEDWQRHMDVADLRMK